VLWGNQRDVYDFMRFSQFVKREKHGIRVAGSTFENLKKIRVASCVPRISDHYDFYFLLQLNDQWESGMLDTDIFHELFLEDISRQIKLVNHITKCI